MAKEQQNDKAQDILTTKGKKEDLHGNELKPL